MNIDHDKEWQAQERARLDERNHAPGADDPLVARYRQVAHALRQAPPPMLPADFAARVAARAGRVPPPLDLRFEGLAMRGLVAALALSGAVAAAYYGSQWLPSFGLLLPRHAPGVVLNWGLALGACLGLTWGLGQLRGHAPRLR